MTCPKNGGLVVILHGVLVVLNGDLVVIVHGD